MIGERIKEARKAAKLTQKELAELAGTAEMTISQYERGIRQPKIGQLQRIASALDVDISNLLQLDFSKPRTTPKPTPEELKKQWEEINKSLEATGKQLSSMRSKIDKNIDELPITALKTILDFTEFLIEQDKKGYDEVIITRQGENLIVEPPSEDQ